MTQSGDQWPPADGDGPAADLAGNPGVIATTLLSGMIAVAVAAAEWVGSGQALDSPAGILWSVVALLGVGAMLLGAGLELRRRRQAARQAAAPRAVAAQSPAADRPEPPPARAQIPELPTGTVTFLFTDIEGSTRLLQQLGGRYPAVRDEHAAILRRAIRDRDGVEVSTEGDSFFAAFASPVAAVGAAVAAQRGLAAHPWPEGFAVRVRMGLHTGEGCWVGTTTSASTSTGRPGSPGRPTAAR
jgi:class 3 adenylate cyclase